MGWGDELMVTGQVRQLQARDPRKVRIVYERSRWHEAWEGNPRIARPDEKGDFQEYVARNGYLRPYMSEKTDWRWVWKPHQPPLGELYLTEDELTFGERHAGRIVVEPTLKGGASPNKDWGWKRWMRLVELMGAKGLQATQLGQSGTRILPGTAFVRTDSMRKAAAVVRHARAAVLPEGGLHHVAAAMDCPAVVIFGGFISPLVTGYTGQRSLFVPSQTWPIGCGARRKCAHCETAMASIEPQHVLERLEEALETNRRSVAA